MIAAHLFFPLLYPILISFFDNTVADVIEHQDYPQLPPATGPFWPPRPAPGPVAAASSETGPPPGPP